MTFAARLERIFNDLPPDSQQEVLDYAQHLLDANESHLGSTKAEEARFYICPVCFAAATQRLKCHNRLMIPCNPDKPEDCKPLMDEAGNFNSRAPRWFILSTARTSENQ